MARIEAAGRGAPECSFAPESDTIRSVREGGATVRAMKFRLALLLVGIVLAACNVTMGSKRGLHDNVKNEVPKKLIMIAPESLNSIISTVNAETQSLIRIPQGFIASLDGNIVLAR